MLDTNILIYAVRKKPESIVARLDAARPGDLCMSVVTFLELAYGAWKSERVKENLSSLDRLREVISVLPLEANTADMYGRLRTQLEREGNPIGPHDLLIAAHALSLKLTLVTNNEREFQRVPKLKVENWTV
jgi:tRNA(fMet)-specific endonuclease VapC